DADMDGAVGLSDYLTILDNFGQFALWDNGDFDRDFEVGLSDYLAILDNFGKDIGPLGDPTSGAVAGVPVAAPQPATLPLLGLGGLTLIRRRRTACVS